MHIFVKPLRTCRVENTSSMISNHLSLWETFMKFFLSRSSWCSSGFITWNSYPLSSIPWKFWCSSSCWVNKGMKLWLAIQYPSILMLVNIKTRLYPYDKTMSPFVKMKKKLALKKVRFFELSDPFVIFPRSLHSLQLVFESVFFSNLHKFIPSTTP